MIAKIYSKSRNTEVHALSLLILGTFSTSGVAEDERLKAIIAKIQEATTALGLSIYRIKTESELKEKNNKRSDAIRSFYRTLGGFTLRDDTTIKTAAEKVLAVFNNYGLNMLEKSYGNETSLTTSLLDDLNTEEMIAYIIILSPLDVIIEELKSAHEAFKTCRIQYEKAKAEEGNDITATELNKKVKNLINNLLTNELYISSELYGDSYSEFEGTINQLITDSNTEVKKRYPKTE